MRLWAINMRAPIGTLKGLYGDDRGRMGSNFDTVEKSFEKRPSGVFVAVCLGCVVDEAPLHQGTPNSHVSSLVRLRILNIQSLVGIIWNPKPFGWYP